MENKEYEIMYQIEDNYWWYRGLRNIVFSLIKNYFPKENWKLLDAGCGTGSFLSHCSLPEAYGLDLFDDALKFCKKRNLTKILRASVKNIPFSRGSFDCIVSLDVLCDLPLAEDMEVLQEFFRVLDEGGILILNLPAYESLKSKHDEAVANLKRYNRREIQNKLESAGFKISKLTYRNSILFPIFAFVRIFKKFFPSKKEALKSDLAPMPGLFNNILTGFLKVENFLIRRSFNFPFGLSLLCVAQKENFKANN